MSARKHIFNARPRTQRGLSIIELMVGIVVALLVGLAASGSAMMFTASQRQGIGSGGVAVNAATALAGLKNDAALAGLGFFGNDRYLCDTLDLSRNATVHFDGAAFVPVQHHRRGNQRPSRPPVRSACRGGRQRLVNADVIAPASFGRVGVLCFPPPSTMRCCWRPTPDGGGATGVCRAHRDGGDAVHRDNAADPHVRRRRSAQSGRFHRCPRPTTTKGQVLLLGELTWHRYRLVGTNLVMERRLLGDSTVLMRNVMAVRMQYGVSTAVGQTSLDSWQDANGLTFGAVAGADLSRVRALRIGVVTRSPQREKENTLGVCEATTALPQLFGEDIMTDVADWRCYRFRTATVVVPLRNLVYGMK